MLGKVFTFPPVYVILFGFDVMYNWSNYIKTRVMKIEVEGSQLDCLLRL